MHLWTVWSSVEKTPRTAWWETGMQGMEMIVSPVVLHWKGHNIRGHHLLAADYLQQANVSIVHFQRGKPVKIHLSWYASMFWRVKHQTNTPMCNKRCAGPPLLFALFLTVNITHLILWKWHGLYVHFRNADNKQLGLRRKKKNAQVGSKQIIPSSTPCWRFLPGSFGDVEL